MLELVRKSDTDFYFKGIVRYVSYSYKKVEVDGEVYTKTLCTKNEFECNEQTCDICIEVDNLSSLGMPVYKVWYPQEFCISVVVSDCGWFYKSSNTRVALLQILDEIGAFKDTLIDSGQEKCIVIAKPRHYFGAYWDEINEQKDDFYLDWELFGYGFNNSVCVKLKIQKLLSLNLLELDKDLLRRLKKTFKKVFSRDLPETEAQKIEFSVSLIEKLKASV